MLESVIAVLIITSVFLCLFGLSHTLTGKVLVEHAAMRVARARAVGMNAFMCEKAARIAVIPVSGKRLQPGGEDERTGIDEAAIARMYMRTPDSPHAEGLLRYERWKDLSVTPGTGGASDVKLKTDWFDVRGEAEVDGYPVYLERSGR